MRGTAGLGEARKVASEMWLQEVGYRDIVLESCRSSYSFRKARLTVWG